MIALKQASLFDNTQPEAKETAPAIEPQPATDENALASLVETDANGCRNLVMRNMGLVGLPDQLFEITEGVDYLEISNGTLDRIGYPRNIITEISGRIGEMKSLKYLILRGLDIERLPKEIGSLINLEKLFVDCDRLIELPPQLWAIESLTDVWVSSDSLSLSQSEIESLKAKGLNSLMVNGVKII